MEDVADSSADLGCARGMRRSIFPQGKLKTPDTLIGVYFEKPPVGIKPLQSVNEERRSHPRYGVHKIVTYVYGSEKLLTLTLDLGLGGMRIRAHHRMSKDEQLTFKLVLGARCIELMGRIVCSRVLHADERVAGVQFTKLSAEDFALLQRYLATLEA